MRKVKPITGFDYDITSDGKVYSREGKKFVQIKNESVVLWKNNEPHKVKIPDLLIQYFPSKTRKGMAGELHPCKQLSKEDVKEIRRLRREEFRTYQDLAKTFGVSQSTIGGIIRYEYWRNA